MERLEFRAMGSAIAVVLDGDGPRARAHLAPVPRWFEAWEDCLSRFRPRSELNRFNEGAGEEMAISRTLWDVLGDALAAAWFTSGLVVPTVLQALEASGYDRNWEAIASRAPAAVIEAAPVPDWRLIERDPRRLTARLPAGTRLDLGGIGKGWAADRAARRLSRFGAALVDAGGDIAISGPTAGEAWPIGVADPSHPDQQLALLRVPRGGVATSGRDYRRWRRGTGWAHHLIDPRTGQPAETDMLTATVVAPSARMAEAASKTMLILGSRDGLAWIEHHPKLAGVAALEDGRLLVSRRMQSYLWS